MRSKGCLVCESLSFFLVLCCRTTLNLQVLQEHKGLRMEEQIKEGMKRGRWGGRKGGRNGGRKGGRERGRGWRRGRQENRRGARSQKLPCFLLAGEGPRCRPPMAR